MQRVRMTGHDNPAVAKNIVAQIILIEKGFFYILLNIILWNIFNAYQETWQTSPLPTIIILAGRRQS